MKPIYPCRVCGHEKGDHQQRIGRGNYTPCCVKNCTCDHWLKERRASVVAALEVAAKECDEHYERAAYFAGKFLDETH